jgi:hypothetical protein
MKYLRTFEDHKRSFYWLLPTDERFEESLNKIGCPESFINGILSNKFRDDRGGDANVNPDFVFIAYMHNSNYKWGWNPYKGNEHDHTFEISHGCKYMGRINIKGYELDSEKYNL